MSYKPVDPIGLVGPYTPEAGEEHIKKCTETWEELRSSCASLRERCNVDNFALLYGVQRPHALNVPAQYGMTVEEVLVQYESVLSMLKRRNSTE
jgi:hypothetical protein